MNPADQPTPTPETEVQHWCALLMALHAEFYSGPLANADAFRILPKVCERLKDFATAKAERDSLRRIADGHLAHVNRLMKLETVAGAEAFRLEMQRKSEFRDEELVTAQRERDAFKQKAAYSERRFVRCVLKAQEAFERHASQGHACDFRTAIQSIKDSLRDHEIADTEFGKLKAERDAAIADREKLRVQLDRLCTHAENVTEFDAMLDAEIVRSRALLSALKP